MKRILVVGLIAMTSCSITSRDDEQLAPEGMQCVEAHQEVFTNGDGDPGPVTLCTKYEVVDK